MRSSTGKSFWGGGVQGPGRIQFSHTHESIISVENLLAAWGEFVRGKRKKDDVQKFEQHLMHNILILHADLASLQYRHGAYEHFKIADPKPRDIHKASVRDRLVHRALYRVLYPFFDRTFIADSYSCRLEKGTHKAMNVFRQYGYKESKNNTKTLWVLKCDIRKFFASIDHQTLKDILALYIPDEYTAWLLCEVIESFSSTEKRKGLPLGNLTSQLLVNIYMNKFDQFVKHQLKVKHYVRYADDFVVLSPSRDTLTALLSRVQEFLRTNLKLELHPNKVSVETLASGIDFLGWVHFTDHRVLRTTTKKRMFRRIQERAGDEATVISYLGLLSHGNAFTLQNEAVALATTLNPQWRDC